ncbi:PAS domain S-box protein [Elioraea sp.]|uniref:hybrid sensor histidine kinase/response regulator n=1 Tax=Elioraea sp. TaxID=2185103 RepID=UPI003F71410D
MPEAWFREITAADPTPSLLVRPDGTVVATNPAADRLLALQPGDDLATLASPHPGAFLTRCSGSREGYFTGLALPLRSGERGSFRCDGALLAMPEPRAQQLVILRLRDRHAKSGGFAALGAKISELHGEIRRHERTGQLLNAVIETAVDGVILSDAHGTVLVFNPACEKLFGYRAEEVVGRNVRMLMPSPFRDEHDGYLGNYHRTGKKRIIGIGREVVGQRKDGTTFPMDLSVGETRQDEERIFVGIIHDLTARKRMEEQLIQAQKMEAVGQLSGGIAHDFNNLLTVIIGSAETLTDRLKARPDLQHYTELIQRAGDRGAELTRRLLAFSRRQMLRPAEIDCNALLESIGTLLRRTLREDVELRMQFDPELWRAIADAGQLESAVLNLALNAQDAMLDGGRITITTANTPLDERYADSHLEVKAGPYVMIAVTDDGHGMPPEVIERAFEPFFTTKEVGKGSGLGLSMVYGFVKQSNGHVSIYSEPGLGTTVRIYLPASRTIEEGRSPADERDEGNDLMPVGRETVLVVEDDAFVRAYAIASLTSLGYHVVPAMDGPEALGMLQNGKPVDLLFTDIVMPGGMNGWELAARAQRLRPGLRVLLTSGYAVETLAVRGRGHMEMLLLDKPYRKAELARRVREALAARPLPE